MTGRPLSEEPLAIVAYCHDGSPEGLLSAVFEAYARREDPRDIAPEEMLQLRLGQSIRRIETDVAHAERVRRGIERAGGKAAFDAVMHASLSDDPRAGVIVYRFIRHVMDRERGHAPAGVGTTLRQRDAPPLSVKGGGVLDDVTHPDVEPLRRLDRAVMNERHRWVQFLRFEHVENELWVARCNPTASVVPLLMDWFSARFNTQPFIIYDETHHLAGVHEGSSWRLVRTDGLSTPDRTADERLMQASWKRFYRTVSVEARFNPELRRQLMPKRLWRNITEMQEDVPGRALSPSGGENTFEQGACGQGRTDGTDGASPLPLFGFTERP